MNFGFEVAHGYEILKGYIHNCETQEEAEKKILAREWDDIIDEFDTEVLTVGYEIVDIWKL